MEIEGNFYNKMYAFIIKLSLFSIMDYKNQITKVGAGKILQLVNCLSSKHENLG